MRPRALLLAGGVLTAGCSTGPARPAVVPAPADSISCLIRPDSTGSDRTVTAAFEDPADAARARRADNVVPPIRLDCHGRPLPGLAVAWSSDSTGRFWTLELREPGTSAIDERWSAAALAATWRADPEANEALEWGGVRSLVPIDSRRLVVGFSSPALELPTLFADRALGVAHGIGRFDILPTEPGDDLRDAVDRDTDLIHTGDPALLDYARQRPGHTIAPLPWSRSYLLVLPPGSRGGALLIPDDTVAFGAGLARDVVRTEARAPERPFWWEQRDTCARHSPPVRPRQPMNAIAYTAADSVARDLAERIVALADDPGLTARALSTDRFAMALRTGQAVGFVLAAPKHTVAACRETAAWPLRATVVPLVETRLHAILRAGTPALVIEWDGTLRTARAATPSGAR